jgi:hypothetical protein
MPPAITQAATMSVAVRPNGAGARSGVFTGVFPAVFSGVLKGAAAAARAGFFEGIWKLLVWREPAAAFATTRLPLAALLSKWNA